MKLKKNDLVLIEWNDAYSTIEQDEDEEMGMTIRTVGFITEQEDPEYVGYAQDWNEKLDKYQGMTYLPKQMIRKITKLNDGDGAYVWFGDSVSELWNPATRRTPTS